MKLRALVCAAVLAAGAALLASCETMSAEECAVADWRGLGFTDASQNGADRFGQRSESCAERGISADFDAYRAGFDEGMYEFCQPSRGFQFAMRGGSFSGSCPADLQGPFFDALSDGRRVYAAEQEVQQARSRVSSLESQRREIDDNIGSRERSLAEATTDEQRAVHRREIERLRRERRDVNDDIRVAQAAIPGLQKVVNDLRYEIGNRWGNW